MREIQVPMPKLSMTMEEGELAAWHRQEGDTIEAGEILCEVASDKAEIEVESPVDGTVVHLHAAEATSSRSAPPSPPSPPKPTTCSAT